MLYATDEMQSNIITTHIGLKYNHAETNDQIGRESA